MTTNQTPDTGTTTPDVEALIDQLNWLSAQCKHMPYDATESNAKAIVAEAIGTIRTLSAEVAALREKAKRPQADLNAVYGFEAGKAEAEAIHAAAIEQARREEREQIVAELRAKLTGTGMVLFEAGISHSADYIEANGREGR